MSLICFLNSASSRPIFPHPPKIYHCYYISHLSKRLFQYVITLLNEVLQFVCILLSFPWVPVCLCSKYSSAPQAHRLEEGEKEAGRGRKASRKTMLRLRQPPPSMVTAGHSEGSLDFLELLCGTFLELVSKDRANRLPH